MKPLSLPASIELTIATEYIHGWKFYPPARIEWTKKFQLGGLWYPPGKRRPARIEVGYDEPDEILFHEIFHGACFESPLSKTDGAWFESFCNTFHTFEKEHPMGCAPWRDIKRKEYRLAREVPGWCRYYGVPHWLLVNACRTRVRFRQLWRRANEISAGGAPAGWFSRAMGFCPETGQQLEISSTPSLSLQDLFPEPVSKPSEKSRRACAYQGKGTKI